MARTALTCDASSSALPEDCDYVRATDDGSIIANDVVLGEAAFHVTETDCPPALPDVIEPGTPPDNGVTYVLFDSTLLGADIYGIDGRLLVIDQCPPPFKKRPAVMKTAGLGAIDGDRVAAIIIEGLVQDDGQIAPVASFLTAPLVKDGKQFLEAVAAGEPTKEPIEPLPTVTLAPGEYHSYTVRVIRGERAELFVDGSAVPALTASYDALPTLDDFGGVFPLGMVSLDGGAFAFHSNHMEVAWSKASVLSCSATPIQIANLAALDSANVATQFLPPARATQIARKLVGNGSASFQLDFAEAFFDAGQTCASVDKHVAAREKTTSATTQLEGFPICPGGANCVELDDQQLVLDSLAVATLQINESLISTCTLDPTCPGCPPPPVISDLAAKDANLRDGVLDSLCVSADQPISRFVLGCDATTTGTSAFAVSSADGVSCAKAAELPAPCGADGAAYALRVVPLGLTGLVGAHPDGRALEAAIGGPLQEVCNGADDDFDDVADDGICCLDLTATDVTDTGTASFPAVSSVQQLWVSDLRLLVAWNEGGAPLRGIHVAELDPIDATPLLEGAIAAAAGPASRLSVAGTLYDFPPEVAVAYVDGPRVTFWGTVTGGAIPCGPYPDCDSFTAELPPPPALAWAMASSPDLAWDGEGKDFYLAWSGGVLVGDGDFPLFGPPSIYFAGFNISEEVWPDQTIATTQVNDDPDDPAFFDFAAGAPALLVRPPDFPARRISVAWQETIDADGDGEADGLELLKAGLAADLTFSEPDPSSPVGVYTGPDRRLAALAPARGEMGEPYAGVAYVQESGSDATLCFGAATESLDLYSSLVPSITCGLSALALDEQPAAVRVGDRFAFVWVDESVLIVIETGESYTTRRVRLSSNVPSSSVYQLPVPLDAATYSAGPPLFFSTAFGSVDLVALPDDGACAVWHRAHSLVLLLDGGIETTSNVRVACVQCRDPVPNFCEYTTCPDDGNPCTACDPETMNCDAPVPDGLSCPMTVGGITECGECVAGTCELPVPPVCDDGNPCTLDPCQAEPAPFCLPPVPAPGGACDDGDPATCDDTCICWNPPPWDPECETAGVICAGTPCP